MNNYIVCICCIIIICLCCILSCFYNSKTKLEIEINPNNNILPQSEENNFILGKPYLWIYWENLNNNKTPDYINLCLQTIFKHCSKSFNIIQLNEANIYQFLPELNNLNIDFSNLLIAQKVDFYRVLLLYKYGGLYIDADTLVLRDPIEIINKLKDYDYVGFGCTGNQCNYGYGKPSNGIMASRPKGILINRVLNNLINKLKNNNKNKYDYFDLGKLIIWQELDNLIINENYKYYHYSNDFDGTRDINGNWIETSYLFSNKTINYKNFNDMIFVIMYNSQMNDLKNLTKNDILNSNTNIAKFFNKSLSN